MRRESVLPPCRAGPVCPAGTNAVFCGGTHGSRPTHLVIASQSADWRGNPFPARQRRADGTSRTPSPTHSVIASQSAPRSKCPWGTDWRGNPFSHKGKDGFPRQCEHWLGMTARQRCKAPSVRGLSAQPTGGEKNRVTSLPPPALRAATSLAEGGFGRPPP